MQRSAPDMHESHDLRCHEHFNNVIVSKLLYLK